ncbi:MAG: hypothetical protein J6L88_01045 [Clostridia bacterium]|nr:hypothetical protein [Clostridia bacterium]
MSALNDILQKIVNQDYPDLVKLAKTSAANLLPVCKQVDPDNKGALMLSAIMLAAIGADGKLTALEQRFLGDVLDMSPSQIDRYTDLYTGNEEELVDKLADAVNSSLKADIVMLVASICAIDETISRDETALIRKLID